MQYYWSAIRELTGLSKIPGVIGGEMQATVIST
jgi:hypothetical protein